jgi:hypothetical protein
MDKVVLGQLFSEYFGFPCQSSFHQLLHIHPHLSSGVCTIGQKWPQYLVDLVTPYYYYYYYYFFLFGGVGLNPH